jgi:hypothetical protein
MRIKIYQIDSELDSERVRFLGSDEHENLFGKMKIDPSIYKQVFNAVIDENDLEDIFRRFNTDGHPLYRGSSMSVSDVVVTEDGKAHFCDSIGFKDIDFDESQATIPDNLFRIVYVEPHRPAYESDMEDSYEGESKAVKGMIELIYNDDGTILVGNDEAKLIGMEGNRHLDNGVSIIAGPFFVIGDDGEDFRSLTDEEVNKYVQKYAEPEDISNEETQADMGFVIYGME